MSVKFCSLALAVAMFAAVAMMAMSSSQDGPFITASVADAA